MTLLEDCQQFTYKGDMKINNLRKKSEKFGKK